MHIFSPNWWHMFFGCQCSFIDFLWLLDHHAAWRSLGHGMNHRWPSMIFQLYIYILACSRFYCLLIFLTRNITSLWPVLSSSKEISNTNIAIEFSSCNRSLASIDSNRSQSMESNCEGDVHRSSFIWVR